MLLLSTQEQQGRAVWTQESFHIFICQAYRQWGVGGNSEDAAAVPTWHRAYISVLGHWRSHDIVSSRGGTAGEGDSSESVRKVSCGRINAAPYWPMQTAAVSYGMFTRTEPAPAIDREVYKRCRLAVMHSLDCCYHNLYSQQHPVSKCKHVMHLCMRGRPGCKTIISLCLLRLLWSKPSNGNNCIFLFNEFFFSFFFSQPGWKHEHRVCMMTWLEQLAN